VLGRSLDELPPQTRRLLMLLVEMVRARCAELKMDQADYRFTRRDVREYTHWGNTQLKIHLQRLEEMEYVLAHRARRGQQTVYELVYDGRGQDGRPVLCGLIDVSKLIAQGNGQQQETNGEGQKATYEQRKDNYEAEWSGGNGEWSGSGRPEVGPKSGPGRGRKNAASLVAAESSDNSNGKPR
jgi:hypothetical protein